MSTRRPPDARQGRDARPGRDARKGDDRARAVLREGTRDEQREQREARRRRSRRRVVWPLLGAATLVGLLFLGVYPTRTFLGQRASLERSEQQLDVLQTQNDEIARQIEALNTSAEIERIAREDYNLVRPGEEAYALLPPSPAPLAIPQAWPFTALAEKLSETGG